MRNYRRISILASSLAFILVCFWFVINSSRLAQDKSLDADVRTAVRELAPLGGTGTKESYYPSGSLKEKTHWKNYEVLRIEYHDLSGRNIYTADLKNGGGLLLDINDDGVIEEIYETVAYSRNGSRFILSDGRLARIILIEHDRVVRDVELQEETPATKVTIPTEEKNE